MRSARSFVWRIWQYSAAPGQTEYLVYSKLVFYSSALAETRCQNFLFLETRAANERIERASVRKIFILRSATE